MIDINELRPAVEAAGLDAIMQEVLEFLDHLEAAESDALEQARLNGMGSEREAALMAKLEAAEKERDALCAELSTEKGWVEDYKKQIVSLQNRLEASEHECTEQARLNGIGAERELALMAKLEATEKERDKLKELNSALRTNSNSQVIHNARLAEENYALRRRIEEVEKECQHALEVKEIYQRQLNETEAERDALRAKIERMEKQEPVGRALLCVRCGTPFDGEHYCPACGHHTATEEAVYAIPGAQPAPSLASNDVSLISEGKTQPAQSVKDDIIDDLQSQFDTEGITEHDSGDALIRLSDAIAAVEDNFAQPAPSIPKGWKEGVEAVAAMLQKKADDYADEYGYDDMGGLSFGGGVGGEIKMDYYNNLIELVEEVRAMLAVALEVKP